MNALSDILMPDFAAPDGGIQSRRVAALWAPVNPLEHPGWDAMVADHPEGSFFHGAAWARVLRDTYGHTPTYFCRISGGRLVDLLPVMEVSSPWTGRRGVSLPFTDYCPTLKSDASPSGELFEGALEHGRSRHWKYLECRGGISQWRGARASLTYYGHVLDLEAGEKALFAGVKSSVRRGVWKAERAGLRIRFGNDVDSMRNFFELHCQTRRRHGLPPQPFRFFENIGRHVIVPGHGWVVSVEQQGHLMAAAIFFHFGRQAIYKFGASDGAFQSLRPSSLLMWEAIKWYASHGYQSMHLGRTSICNDGLRRFKLGFGAREQCVEYCRYDISRAAFVTDADRVKGWFNPVFRALPQPVLRFAGAALYPHLS